MGRRVKTRSNPALAEPHAAGAPVFICQLLAHDRYGAIAYHYPRLWRYHYQTAEKASEAMLDLHERVLEIEPGRNGIRFVPDDALLFDVYSIGTALVSNAVRAVQHLAEEIEHVCKQKLKGQTSADRINEAAALFSNEQLSASPDYSGFGEIVAVRDALEHPQDDNVRNTTANGWTGVPLAWMLSNRSLDAWSRFHRWLSRFAADWEEHLATLPPTPGEVSVQRGIESRMAVKKPPRAR